jgi:hypothetical protein
VSGKVYEEDSQRPFAGVDVGLVPPGSGFADEEQFQDAATTGPQGSFSFDCDDLLPGRETAMIALSYAGWGGCIDVTERRVRGGDLAENVTLYVSEKVQEFLGHAYGLPKNDNCEPPGRSGG